MRYKVAKAIYKILFVAVLVGFGSLNATAADGPCDPFDPEPDCEDYDPDVPIDGGASILVAAGVAFGLKKIYDKRKGIKQEVE